MSQQQRDPISRACLEFFSSVVLITKPLVWAPSQTYPSIILMLTITFTLHVEVHALGVVVSS